MDIESFIAGQLAAWPEAAERHAALDRLEIKTVTAFGVPLRVQFNPARAVSTAAKVDAAAIAARPCFLCEKNRPACQTGIDLGGYTLLVNPFPIHPGHLVIAANDHRPQSLHGETERMREFSRLLPGYAVIFNGARAGASAPDHQHFQAVPRKFVEPPQWCFTYELPEGVEPEEDEMVNAICIDGVIRIIPRRAHRPGCYGDVVVSPASLDIGGCIITVRREDFDRLDTDLLENILADVTYLRPEVEVGIMECAEPKISVRADGLTEVADVTIGVGFHWQRRQNQAFAGKIELRPLPSGLVRVVNRVDVEEYLRSVIASEMAATSSVELLKAHAVISRSWLMAQMRVTRVLASRGTEVEEPVSEHDEILRWYDRDDHIDFDVCADDHCQRYQGALRASTPQVDEAIAATCGMVLADADGLIADARFSKCCGGVTELFENCWQPRHHSYLVPIYDAAGADAPACFCSTRDSEVLRQVLNDFDRDTTPDFYRWTVTMGQNELSELVKRKSGIDFGIITELMPLHRGPSGRITRLRITGTKRTVVVGKELEIRRWLSESHLRSSAFSVERGDDGSFTLHGAGWGHGVGLCQIGAAVMASQGYDYRSILTHYFPTTHIIRLYR